MQEDVSAALIEASREGHVESVRVLLAAGAAVAQAEPNGWTALMAASLQGHLDCARTLLEAGAAMIRPRRMAVPRSSRQVKGGTWSVWASCSQQALPWIRSSRMA